MYRSRSRLRSWCLLRGASMGSDPKRPSGLFDFMLPPSPPKDDTLAGLLGGLAPIPPGGEPPRQSYSLLDLARALNPSPPRNPFGSFAPPLPPAGNPFDFLPPSPPRTSNPFGSLVPSPPSVGNFLDFPVPSPPPRRAAIPAAEPKKRRAFFSFHFEDVRRSVIVRNAWKFTDPENNSFVDSSLWEKSKLKDPETIKQLIRDGVSFTSVACVLVGSGTWLRRWVRYEIARAIIDGLGLLAVHLNSIRDPNTRTTLPSGLNPLSCMAVGKVQVNAWEPVRYFLFERELNVNTWKFEWVRYEDYTHQVKLPRWLPDPTPGFVTPLAPYAGEYDYMMHQGHRKPSGAFGRGDSASTLRGVLDLTPHFRLFPPCQITSLARTTQTPLRP